MPDNGLTKDSLTDQRVKVFTSDFQNHPDMMDSDHNLAYSSISTILDSLDALVYVTDMQTNEILFFNEYGRSIWGDAEGKICWQVLQSGQTGPCDFCTNDKLVNENGEPTGVYVWEFQNTVNDRWYQCRDQAIKWMDGRLVRMEIATDITDRKQAEEELKIAMERAEVLARRDELTGLNNRRAFYQDGEKLINQVKRYTRPLSLIMLDIDHFKETNDNYGHSAGDSVLEVVAAILMKHVREVDVHGRLGGEEFAVMLPETSLNNAAKLAERLRVEIEKTTIGTQKGEVKTTASFGIASVGEDHVSLEELINKADDALYQAKWKGRNRIETAKQ